MAFKFDAFISYSHAADGALAPALQSALHRLARPFFKLHALRIFRDATSLSASPELWPAIEAALRDARCFLLLASPAAAQSRWVQREIAWWLAHRSAATLYVLVTSGELAWDEDANDVDWTRTDCLPRDQLAGRFQSEPLWVDLRWAQQGETLTLRHARFRQAVLDIAAPLHGIDKDQLDSDDVRRLARVRHVSALVMAGLAGLALVAFLSFLEARRQRAEAERRGVIAEARRLAAQADLARVQGDDTDLPVLLAAQGMRLLGAIGAPDMAVDLSLRRALAHAPRVLHMSPPQAALRLREDGSWTEAALNTYWPPQMTRDPIVLASGDCRRQLSVVVAAATRGQWCVLTFQGRFDVYRGVPTRAPQQVASLPIADIHPGAGKHISEDGQWLAIDEERRVEDFRVLRERQLRVWHVASGRLVHTEMASRFLGFAPRGGQFATASGLWRLPAAAPAVAQQVSPWVKPAQSAAFSANGRFAAVRGSSDDEVELWSLATGRNQGFVRAAPGAVLAVDDRGASVMVGSGTALQLLSSDGQRVERFAMDARAAVFAPDGPRVLAHKAQRLRVLALPNEAAAFEARVDTGNVLALVATPDSAAVWVREERPLQTSPGVSTTTHRLRLERWHFGSGARQTLFEVDHQSDLAISADGRRWATLSQRGHVLHIGHTDMAAPPVEVVELNSMSAPWVANSGAVAAVVDTHMLAVRAGDGALRWLSAPLGSWVMQVMLNTDGTRMLTLRWGRQTRGVGLDRQSNLLLESWAVGREASGPPEQSIDLGFHERAPGSLCFVSADGTSVRRQGQWQALAAAGPASAADLDDRSGCVQALPHGLELALGAEGRHLDIGRQGEVHHRLESAVSPRHVVASPGGEVAVVLDQLGRLRSYPLTADRLVAQACARPLRLLTAAEALRFLGPAARQDACGRDFAVP